MPDLDDLRALLAVIDTRSVKRAAQQIGVPRSTLRRRLDSLEQRVGVPLLWLDVSGAHPTPAARVLVHEGQVLLDTYQALIERARQTPDRE